MDTFFCARFLDKGHCGGCDQDTMGMFGVMGCEVFYCRKCWCKYMSSEKDCLKPEFDDWQTWCEDQSKKRQVTESVWHHKLKCVLLAVSEIPGASVSFPASLKGYDRQAVHSFIEKESALQALRHQSYGSGDTRFMLVGNGTDGSAEARTVAHATAHRDGSGDVDKVTEQLGKLDLGTSGMEAKPPAPHSGSCKTKAQGSASAAAPPEPAAPPPQPPLPPKQNLAKAVASTPTPGKATVPKATTHGSSVPQPMDAERSKQATAVQLAGFCSASDFPALAPTDDFPSLAGGAAGKQKGKNSKRK